MSACLSDLISSFNIIFFVLTLQECEAVQEVLPFAAVVSSVSLNVS